MTRLDAAMVVAKAKVLLVHGGVEYNLQERINNQYVAVDHCLSAARLVRETVKVRRHEAV